MAETMPRLKLRNLQIRQVVGCVQIVSLGYGLNAPENHSLLDREEVGQLRDWVDQFLALTEESATEDVAEGG